MMVETMMELGVSHRQACNETGLARSTQCYKPVQNNDEAVIEQLQALIEKHPAIGFWQCYYRIRRKGFAWNHKRVYRVYTDLKLNIRRRYSEDFHQEQNRRCISRQPSMKCGVLIL